MLEVKPTDVLRSQIDDGCCDGEFSGCVPVDIGDGWAVAISERWVAIYADGVGGTAYCPIETIRKLWSEIKLTGWAADYARRQAKEQAGMSEDEQK